MSSSSLTKATSLAPPTSTPALPRDRTPRSAKVIAWVTCALLLGSLFPPLGPARLHLYAVPPAIVLAFLTLIGPHRSARTPWVVLGPLFLILIAAISWSPPPLTEYGEDKFSRLWTSTLISTALGTAFFLRSRVRSLAAAWVWASIPLAVATLVAGESTYEGRSAAFGANPIWVARALGTATIATIALPRLGYPRKYLALAPLFMAGLFATGSRGPFVATLVGILVLLITSTSRTLVALVVTGGGYLTLISIPSLKNSRIGSLLSSVSQGEEVGANRSELWISAWTIWQENRWGVGFGNWSHHSQFPTYSYPHNIFLEVAAELGTLPAVFLLAALGVSLISIAKGSIQITEKRLLLAMLATEAISVSVSGDLSARTFFFLLAASLALAAGEHQRNALGGGSDNQMSPAQDNLPLRRSPLHTSTHKTI